MILLPPRLCRQHRPFSAENGVSDNEFAGHLKCMRYFPDF